VGPMPDITPLMPPLSDPDWQAWQPVRDRFADAWRQGSGPELADYLPPAPLFWQVLDLALLDLEYGLKRGAPQRVEDYLRRCPALAEHPGAVAALVRTECEQRSKNDPGAASDIRQRFPQLADAPWLAYSSVTADQLPPGSDARDSRPGV